MFYESSYTNAQSVKQSDLITDVIINTAQLGYYYGFFISLDSIATEFNLADNVNNNTKLQWNSYILKNRMYSKPIATWNRLFTNYWDYNKLQNQELSTDTTIVSQRLNADIFLTGTYYHMPVTIERRNVTRNTAYTKLTKTQYNLTFDDTIQVNDALKKFSPSGGKNRIIIVRRDDIGATLISDNIYNLGFLTNPDIDIDDNFIVMAQDTSDLTTYKMFLYYQGQLYMTIYDNVYKENTNYEVMGCYQIWEVADDSEYPRNRRPASINNALSGSLTVYNWDNDILRKEAEAI